MKKLKYLLLVCCILSLTPILSAKESKSTDTIELNYVFQLYGQTRRYKMEINTDYETGVRFDWTIFSYQKWLKGSYHISQKGLCCGTDLNFIQPINGAQEYMKDNETFGLISVNALKYLKENNSFVYNNTTYRLQKQDQIVIEKSTFDVYFVIADIDNTKMWIWDNEKLPLILKIENNPLEINYYIESFTRK